MGGSRGGPPAGAVGEGGGEPTGRARAAPERLQGIGIACVAVMRVLWLPGFVLAGSVGVAGPAAAQAPRDPAPRPMLAVTVADLDEDQFDFLIGWQRGQQDILDLASRGVARFALAPLLPEWEPEWRFPPGSAGRPFALFHQRPAPAGARPLRPGARRSGPAGPSSGKAAGGDRIPRAGALAAPRPPRTGRTRPRPRSAAPPSPRSRPASLPPRPGSRRVPAAAPRGRAGGSGAVRDRGRPAGVRGGGRPAGARDGGRPAGAPRTRGSGSRSVPRRPR